MLSLVWTPPTWPQTVGARLQERELAHHDRTRQAPAWSVGLNVRPRQKCLSLRRGNQRVSQVLLKLQACERNLMQRK